MEYVTRKYARPGDLPDPPRRTAAAAEPPAPPPEPETEPEPSYRSEWSPETQTLTIIEDGHRFVARAVLNDRTQQPTAWQVFNPNQFSWRTVEDEITMKRLNEELSIKRKEAYEKRQAIRSAEQAAPLTKQEIAQAVAEIAHGKKVLKVVVVPNDGGDPVPIDPAGFDPRHSSRGVPIALVWFGGNSGSSFGFVPLRGVDAVTADQASNFLIARASRKWRSIPRGDWSRCILDGEIFSSSCMHGRF